MTQNRKLSKLKNLVSFGTQRPKVFEGPSAGDLAIIRCQESSSMDIDKQLNNLGLQVVNVSQLNLSQSMDLNQYCYINKEKFKRVIGSIWQNIRQMKEEFQAIKRRQKQFLNTIDFSKIIQEVNQKIAQTEMRKNILDEPIKTYEDSCFLQNQSRFMKQHKLLLESTVYSLRFRKELSLSLNNSLAREQRSREKQKSIESYEIYKELNKLRQEIFQKNREIQLLRQQLVAVKKFYEKKEEYFNQKLKLKQIQWERKINEILKECHYTSKQAHQHRIQIKKPTVQNENQKKRLATESSGFNSPPHRRSPQSPSWFLTQKTLNSSSIQDYCKIKDMSFPRHYALVQCQNNLKGYLQGNIVLDKKIEQKWRINRQKQRKHSTDQSYERVHQKIKSLEFSLKMDALKANI